MDANLVAFLDEIELQEGCERDAIAEALTKALALAREAWPAMEVPALLFLRRVWNALPRTPAEPAKTLRKIHTTDVYLACACLQRIPEALRAFEVRCLALVPRFVARFDGSPAFADEVRQELGRKLLVGNPPKPPALSRFSGKGPLVSFVAVSAQRTALDLLRRRGEVHVSDEKVLQQRLSTAQDPELAVAKARLAAAFDEALRAAILGLSVRQRMILRLTLISGLSLEKVGNLYGVNASTICRWLAQARDRLLAQLKEQLSRGRNLAHEDLTSLARLVRSELDIGLSALLASRSPSSDST